MALTQSQLETYLRHLLGVETDDAFYTTAKLNSFLEQAHRGLCNDIQKENPEWFVKTATTTESSARVYASLVSDAGDLRKLLEVRVTNVSGARLSAVRLKDLQGTNGSFYAIYGMDDAATIEVSPGVTSTGSSVLWLRYSYWPTAMTTNTQPDGIPDFFQELVALEAYFVFALGDEDTAPAEIQTRWVQRRQGLIDHVKDRLNVETHVDSISTRDTLRRYIRMQQGVEDTTDDPRFSNDALNLALQIAHRRIVDDINLANPSYFYKTATATESADHLFDLPSDWHRMLEVRHTDKDGLQLLPRRVEHLENSGEMYYSIGWQQDADLEVYELTTSDDTPTGITLWFRYERNIGDMDSDDDIPFGVPARYVEVVALEACQHLPRSEGANPALQTMWADGRGALMHYVGRTDTAMTDVRGSTTPDPRLSNPLTDPVRFF